MTEQASTAEAELIEWARINRDRDNRIRRALAAGITKHRIHTLTGISRATIDRLLDKEPTMTRMAYDFGTEIHVLDLDEFGAHISGTEEVLPLSGDRDETLGAAGYATVGQWDVHGEAEGVEVTR